MGMLLLATLIATLVPFSTVVYAQNQDEKFKKIAEQAKEKVDELGALIGDALGIPWPSGFPADIQDAYGVASSDLATGDYKDAMKACREVFKMLNIYAEAEGLVFERGVGGKAQGLFVAIDRANETIARIEDVVGQIQSDNDVETFIEWVNHNVTEAKDDLSEAVVALELEPPNIGWAEGNLTEARKNISEAFTALRLIAGWTSFWRIESFLQGVKKSVQRTLELLERLGIDVEELLGTLEYTDEDGDGKILDDFLDNIESRLDEARVKAKAREIKDATAILREIRLMLTEIHQEMAKGRRG